MVLMGIVKKEYKISAPIGEVWKALIQPEIIAEWGGRPIKMDAKVGTEFKLWDGDIHGKNIEVIKEKKLVQEWFSGEWPKPSIVTFILQIQDHETILELEHINVPDEEVDDIDQGWNDYYIGPMKELLEKKYVKKK